MSKPTCQHVFTKRSKKAGQQCSRNANYNNRKYCYQHKKKYETQEDILNTDPVFTQESAQIPQESAKEKLKYSSFNITINSNSIYQEMSDEKKQLFKDFVEFLFSEENIDEILIDQTNKENPRENIRDFKAEKYFEVGTKQNRLHVHGAIEVEHVGFYRMDIPKINQLARRIFGKQIHMDIKAISNPEKLWRQYMLKHQEANKVEL